jgi:hypothetical protein
MSPAHRGQPRLGDPSGNRSRIAGHNHTEVTIMKKLIINSWDAVMDNRYNPLRHLDPASQHFMMQVLGWMWSMIFSLSFLSIFYFSVVWMAHLLLLGGVALTVATFRQAEKQSLETNSRLRAGAAPACVWMLDKEA